MSLYPGREQNEWSKFVEDGTGNVAVRVLDGAATRNLLWDTSTDFNKGTYTNTEIYGSGISAIVQLGERSDNSDNINFLTAGDYTYDPTKVEVSGGLAQLKPLAILEYNWDFETPSEYTYGAEIEVTGGTAEIKAEVSLTPYAHWHLNESSGNIVTDSSGNGRNGTRINMEDIDWVSGKLNNCLVFDGVDEYVSCGNIGNFERTQPFTLDLWIKFTSTDTKMIISKIDMAPIARGWELFVAVGKIYFLVCSDFAANNYFSVNTNDTFNTGGWHHVIVTYSGSSLASGVNIYVANTLRTLTITKDTLTGTILNSAGLNIASRDNSTGYCFSGYIDEIAIYDKVIDVNERGMRWNTGYGYEYMQHYFITDPTIYCNTGFVFDTNLSVFTETSTKPSGTELKYNISSDNGVTWKYWNGSSWTVANGTYSQANTSSEINTNVYTLSTSGTFKFKAFLHSDNGSQTPLLDNIYAKERQTYTTGNHEIVYNNSIDPTNIISWLNITETITKPSNTNIKYKYSIDDVPTWNGSWLTSGELQTNIQAISVPDKLRLKFQLSSTDNSVTPIIDNLNITSDAGYYSSGTYESNIYDSGENNIDWGIISYDITVPTGSLTFKARASNNNSVMGSYGSVLINGSETNVIGRYLQWKCDFIGNGATTPNINYTGIMFALSQVIEVSP